MKALNVLGNIGSFLKWAGVLTAIAYYGNGHKQFVAVGMVAALIGLMIDKAARVYTNVQLRELKSAESVEWSYLNVIRLKLEKDEAVDSVLLARAKTVTAEAEDAYERIYGFGRPATAIRRENHNI